MNVVLLEPHADDGILFHAFGAIRFQPLFVTVLAGPEKQNVQRWDESDAAISVLGCQNLRWEFDEKSVDWDVVHEKVGRLRDGRIDWDHVLAPAVEDGGHEQHNYVGEIADDIFGPENVTHYMTYRRGFNRSQSGTEVIPEPGWVALKMQAMACYTSQIENPLTRPWFTGECGDWSREFIQ